MVYSLENIRFLRQELDRLTEQSLQLRESLAELKRRAGLDPDETVPVPETDDAPASPTFGSGFFAGRFNV